MVEKEELRTVEAPKPVEPSELPEEELRWSTVHLKEVFSREKRLEASVFDIEGKHARETIKNCKWPTAIMVGENGIATAFYPPRFRRIIVEKSEFPLFLPSQIQEINPRPKGYLSPLCNTDFKILKAKKGQILITRSGTIGNSSIVGKTLDGKTLSDDIIRIICKEEKDTGYLYAFLKTKIGNTLVKTNEYGAVVSHIEPEHLESVPIPNPPNIIKKRIHDLIFNSFSLRDESNVLLDEAEALLYEALNLQPIRNLKATYFNNKADIRNYSIKLSNISGRFDASYHIPIVDTIMRKLKKEASELIHIGDSRISKRVILPGRFARIYVEEGQGTVFFGGKQIYELDPSNKKYLSLKHHGDRIKKELLLEENMIIVTCSGTIGKVALVPKHWEGWTANQHIIRVVPSSIDIGGYLYVFLASDYGHELIKRFTYGSVVDEIDDRHISAVEVPLLKDQKIQKKINCLALDANAKRTEAYYLEQKAIRIINDEVIYATT